MAEFFNFYTMEKIFALVDERISNKCRDALTERGFQVIRLPKIEALPAPIASHTDILTCKIGDTLFFSKPYFDSFFDTNSPLNTKNIRLIDDVQGATYPLDAIFNGLVINDKLFCKTESFSKEIINYAVSIGMEIISVKQGYPACTTLKISENCAITADKGMARALRLAGISVLDIENGGVALPPYEYGFIGGAAGVFHNEIYFLGDVQTHPDSDRIIEFIRKENKEPISLSDETLSDLGGIIFI